VPGLTGAPGVLWALTHGDGAQRMAHLHLEPSSSSYQPASGARWLPKGDAAREGNQAGPGPLRAFCLAGPVRRQIMDLHCWPGCLAIVIKDTPACEINIGRLVWVRGPLEFSLAFGMHTWLVRPLTAAPYAMEYGDEMRLMRVDWSTCAEHPDSWLLPIRFKFNVDPFKVVSSDTDGASTPPGTELEASLAMLQVEMLRRRVMECPRGTPRA
jgi:hypothetical protein